MLAVLNSLNTIELLEMLHADFNVSCLNPQTVERGDWGEISQYTVIRLFKNFLPIIFENLQVR